MRRPAAIRSLTQPSVQVCAQERSQAATAAASRPPRYHHTSVNGTSLPFCLGISTSSTSGMVRYGGTNAAAVLASERTPPKMAMPACGRANEISRTSARHEAVPPVTSSPIPRRAAAGFSGVSPASFPSAGGTAGRVAIGSESPPGPGVRASKASSSAWIVSAVAGVNSHRATTRSPEESSIRPTADRSCTSSREPESISHSRGPRTPAGATSAEAGSSAISRLFVSTIQPSLNRKWASRSNRPVAKTVSPGANRTGPAQGREPPSGVGIEPAAGGPAVIGAKGP